MASLSPIRFAAFGVLAASLSALSSAYVLSSSMMLRNGRRGAVFRANQRVSSARKHTTPNMQLGREVSDKGMQGYAGQAGLSPADYIAFGLAQCYRMEEGILNDVWVVEPLTGATLECLHGIAQEGQSRVSPPTSYRRVIALRADEVFEGTLERPTGINMAALAPLMPNGEVVQLCDDAVERTLAAGRTLRRRLESQIIPQGQTYDKYNYQPSTNKRIVNMKNEVNDSDNVKQDMSIDVYGREKDEGKGSKMVTRDSEEMV